MMTYFSPSFVYRPGPPPPNQESRTNLLVRYLDHNITDEILSGFFSQYGPVLSTIVQRDIHTGRSRGFGFVRFAASEHATAALELSRGAMLGNRRIDVLWASQQHDDVPTGEERLRMNKLFLRNVPVDLLESDVFRLLSAFGTVTNVSLHDDNVPVRCESERRRIAFVTFEGFGAADAARRGVHNTVPFPSCNGVPLMAKLSEDYRQRERPTTSSSTTGTVANSVGSNEANQNGSFMDQQQQQPTSAQMTMGTAPTTFHPKMGGVPTGPHYLVPEGGRAGIAGEDEGYAEVAGPASTTTEPCESAMPLPTRHTTSVSTKSDGAYSDHVEDVPAEELVTTKPTEGAMTVPVSEERSAPSACAATATRTCVDTRGGSPSEKGGVVCSRSHSLRVEAGEDAAAFHAPHLLNRPTAMNFHSPYSAVPKMTVPVLFAETEEGVSTPFIVTSNNGNGTVNSNATTPTFSYRASSHSGPEGTLQQRVQRQHSTSQRFTLSLNLSHVCRTASLNSAAASSPNASPQQTAVSTATNTATAVDSPCGSPSGLAQFTPQTMPHHGNTPATPLILTPHGMESSSPMQQQQLPQSPQHGLHYSFMSGTSPSKNTMTGQISVSVNGMSSGAYHSMVFNRNSAGTFGAEDTTSGSVQETKTISSACATPSTSMGALGFSTCNENDFSVETSLRVPEKRNLRQWSLPPTAAASAVQNTAETSVSNEAQSSSLYAHDPYSLTRVRRTFSMPSKLSPSMSM